jgi:hypothetical protein
MAIGEKMKTSHIVLIGLALVVVGYFVFRKSTSEKAKDMMKTAVENASQRAARGSGASLTGSTV